MELSADTSWLEWGGKNLSWTRDLKPYVLIQSTLGNKHNALIPYVGIAPVLSVSGVDYDNKNYETQIYSVAEMQDNTITILGKVTAKIAGV